MCILLATITGIMAHHQEACQNTDGDTIVPDNYSFCEIKRLATQLMNNVSKDVKHRPTFLTDDY
jgi:hypothetical protein